MNFFSKCTVETLISGTENMMGVLILVQCRMLVGSVRKIMKTAKNDSDKMKKFCW